MLSTVVILVGGTACSLVTSVVGFVTIPLWGPFALCYNSHVVSRRAKQKKLPLLFSPGDPEVSTTKSNDLI